MAGRPDFLSLVSNNTPPRVKTNPSAVKELTTLLTDEEVKRIGKEKYEQRFAPTLDTEENRGKFFVLDVITDAHEVGDNLLALLKNATNRNSDDNIYVCRIGSKSVFSLH